MGHDEMGHRAVAHFAFQHSAPYKKTARHEWQAVQTRIAGSLTNFLKCVLRPELLLLQLLEL